jgi:hypothetical protein
MPLVELETEVRKPPACQADTLGRDANRWTWDGLCIAFPFLEAGPAGWREIITGARPSTVSGTVTGGRDKWGQVIVSQAGNAGYLDYADQPRHRLPASGLTVCCRFRYNGSADTGWSLFGKVHTDGGVKSTWGVYSQDTSCRLMAVLSTSVAEYSTNLRSTDPIPSGTYSNVFYRWATDDLLTIDVLADGGATVGVQASSTSGLAGTLVYAAAPLRIFGTDNPVGLGGDVSVFLVYARKLTDTEIRALACDPFLPFRRPVRSPTELGLGESGMQYIGPTRS